MIIALCAAFSNVHAQGGKAFEEAFLELRKVFSHREPIPSHIPEWHPVPPKTTSTVGENTARTIGETSIIVKDGQILSRESAIAGGLITHDATSIKSLSPSVKIVKLDRTQLRVYREHFGLPVNGELFPKQNVEIYDEGLIRAVKTFQRKNHLAETGVISGKTERCLKNELRKNELIDQQFLKKNYTAKEKEDAIIAFQAVNNLPVTGKIGRATAAKFDEYIFTSLFDIESRASTYLDNGRTSAFSLSFGSEGDLLVKFGWCSKQPTKAEKALSIINFQEAYGLPKTATLDAETTKTLLEFGEIDKVIPSAYKTNGKLFPIYSKQFLKDFQQKNDLLVSGELNTETRLAIRPELDKQEIKTLRTEGFLHNDFVTTEIASNYKYRDFQLYFNTGADDYFIIKNDRIGLDKLLAYKINRLNGSVSKSDVVDVLERYDQQAADIMAKNTNKCTLIHCGLINENGMLSVQVGSKSIVLEKQQINDFIESNVEIPELTTAIAAGGDRPIVVFRPDYATAKSGGTNTYADLYGTGYSSINTAKFTAAVNLRYGRQKAVFLASDVKNAIRKLAPAIASDINPQFRIYTPNKVFFSDKFGWHMDDYHMVNNLRGRGIYKDRITALPKAEIAIKPEEWIMANGPKMFIGHNNDDFQSFITFYAKNQDKSPLFIVSCYDQGNEYFISQLIQQQKVANVIYFSEIISPTAASDVIAEYYKLSRLPANVRRPFKSLWSQSIEAVRTKNALRYSDHMKAELNKLYKVIFMLTRNESHFRQQEAA